jgi:PST family polysaccharide transporter
MSIGRKAAHGVAWNMIFGVGSRVIQLIGTLITAHYVIPDDYGVVMSASIVVITASAFTSFSFGQYIIAKRATAELAIQAAVVHIVLGLAASLVVWVLRDRIGALIGAPGMGRYILGYAIANLVIDRIRYVPERLIMRALRFRTLAMINGAGDLAFTATSILTAMRFGPWAFMFAALARSITTSTLFIAAAPRAEWLVKLRMRAADVRDMLGYGLPIMVSIITDNATRKWDNIVVERIFGPGVMGGYNYAYSLAETPINNVAEHIGEVLMPSFSLMEDGQREQAAVRAASLMGLVVSPLGVGLGAVAPTLANTVFNKQWGPLVGPMLVILSVMTVFRPMPWSAIAYAQAVQRTRVLMWSSFMRAVLVLSLVAVGGLVWDPRGACIGAGVGYAAHSLWTVIATGWVTKLPAGKYLIGVARPLLPCIPMFFAVIGLAHVLDGLPLVVSLILQIAGGAVVYVAAAFVLVRDRVDELIRLGRDAIRRRR